MPAAGSAGIRTGAGASAMRWLSNQARTSGVELRPRIDRARTVSIVAPGVAGPVPSWAQKASSVKSQSSSVAGAASTRDTSSTRSCRSSRTGLLPPFRRSYESVTASPDICPWWAGLVVPTVRDVPVLKKALLAAARRPGLRRVVTGTPVTRRVVDRFVAGETLPEALDAVRALAADGLAVTMDHLGEDVTDRHEAERSRDAYLALLDGLAPLGLGRRAEVSVKLSAFGQALPVGGHDVALELVRPGVEAATAMGTTVTLDMEDSPTVDSTLAVLAELRREHPGTGAVLQAMLHRTEDDARALAVAGSRVRLVKGAYDEPASVAYQDRAAVDASYARPLCVLMRGDGHPMVGSHDPRMVELAQRLPARDGRDPPPRGGAE